MRKNIINLRILFFILLSIVMINTNAQTGLNFQGVARTTNNVILASQAITIKLSILQGSATGTADYTETRRVTTNAQGLFTAVIGDTGAISTLGNFTNINWKLTPKFLKIEMDVAAGTNYITMGTTQFQYVAYAQFAKSVDAENIVGIVPVTLGGTGVSTIAGLKTALVLNNVNNTTDLTKPISTLTQTALDLKLNATDTSKYTKQTYSDSALLTKLKISDTAAMLSSRIARDTLNLSNRINLKINTTDLTSGLDLKLNKADTIKFTKQTYSDSALLTKLKISDTAAMLSSRIARDTLSLSNRINLKANTTDVTTSLSLKESISNKSTAVDLGGTTPSDILFPTQKAVKDYVTANNSGGGVADGGITTIKIADGAVTDAKINTVSGSKVVGNIIGNAATATLAINATTAGNITATTNTTLTSLSSLTSVGTIASGVWSGTIIDAEHGGTGNTNLKTAIKNLGSDIIVNSITVGKGKSSISSNTAIGDTALGSNQDGSDNTAIGLRALRDNIGGIENTAIGSVALLANRSGNYNTALGKASLYYNDASYNTAVGNSTLFYNTNGSYNTAVGNSTLFYNTNGSYNTAIGYQASFSSFGSYNTSIGNGSFNTSGDYNIAIGNAAFVGSSGLGNVVIGDSAQNAPSSTMQLTNCTVIGKNSFFQEHESITNSTIIGSGAIGTSSNQITLGNRSISTLRAQVTSITALSDRRDKTDIIPIGEGLAFLKKLNPVSFTWNTRDKAKIGIKAAGFIAQELLALQKQSKIGENLDLVSQDNPDKLEARYGNLLPVIVKAIQEESAEKDKEIKALKETLNKLERRLNQLLNKK
jgi:hypothetical protein